MGGGPRDGVEVEDELEDELENDGGMGECDGEEERVT